MSRDRGIGLAERGTDKSQFAGRCWRPFSRTEFLPVVKMLRFTRSRGYRDPGLPRDLLTCAILESAPEGLPIDLFCPGSRLGAETIACSPRCPRAWSRRAGRVRAPR